MKQSYVSRLWHSPTVTTWASTTARASGLAIVLPLLLTRLDTGEIAVWYLFSSIIALQMVADAGFAPTFARVIAYAMGGAQDLKGIASGGRKELGEEVPNLALITEIWSTASAVYNRLSLGAISLLAVLGTLALYRPITQLAHPSGAWISWSVVLFATGCVLRGNIFSAYLQGVNEIATFRRWEAITSLLGTVSSIVVLLAGGRLLALALSTQFWVLVFVLRDRALCRFIQARQFGRALPSEPRYSPEVFAAVWPAAWRSAIGIAMSRGLVAGTGLVYAQVSSAADLASYLLALRLVGAVGDMSQAPFYSKLPLLARLLAAGRTSELLAVARRGMRLSYWTFVAGVLLLGAGGTLLLPLLHSHAAFPPQLLWALMGLAFLMERFGAMNLQLYSTTNHIVWHKATLIAGSLNIATAFVLFPYMGMYAFPVALIVSYAGFYCWYSARFVYRMFSLRAISYESTLFAPPLAVLILYFFASIPR